MSQQFWHQFCGHGENFTLWKDADFGHCFEQLVVVCPAFTILTICSAYYIAATNSNTQGVILPIPWFVKIRLLSCILLCVIPVVVMIVTKVLNEISVSYSDIVTACFVSLSWLVHTVYVLKLKYSRWDSWRGATPMLVMLLLPLLSTAAQLHTSIVQSIHHGPAHNMVEETGVYVSTFLLIFYLFTLIPKGERVSLGNNGACNHAINSVHESRSLLSSSSSNYQSILTSRDEQEVAEEGVNCLSWLTFHWAHKLLSKGAGKAIHSVRDLYYLPTRLNTHLLFVKFTAVLMGKCNTSFEGSSDFLSKSNMNLNVNSVPDVSFSSSRHTYNDDDRDKKQLTLLRALNKAYGLQYYSLGILKLLADCFGFAGPILLNLLVSFIETKSDSEGNGYWYASGLFLSTLLGSICSTQFDYNSSMIGYKIRASIITTIYRKALSVNSVNLEGFSSGQIINFMSTDTDRIVNFCPSFHAFWSLPFQISVSLYLLHQQVGLAFLAGLGFALILIPINRWLANKIGKLSQAMMEQKDKRVKVMNEILFGMRIVKLYSWEEHFKEKVNQLRDAELKNLKGRKYLDAMCVYFWATTPVLISILTFTTYSLMGHQLTAAKVFTSLSLFLMLISPLNAFPWVLNGLMESWVSLKRVQAFVALNDQDLERYYSSVAALPEDCALRIDDAEFSWQENKHQAQRERSESGGLSISDAEIQASEPLEQQQHFGTLNLVDINIHVNKGQFVGVIGKVGAGKTSLLACILAEMHHVKGCIQVNDLSHGFAVATQDPWIQHATVRDNILFGLPFDSRKYQGVIDACALTEDLKMLPAGDMTEVGENGVTLSGGQKARVALARAVYQRKDVFLLDDPLSAVDAHVAQHLYQKCIMGLLAGKTRILCTHHTKYLLNADLIVVMDNGHIVKTGVPSEILASEDLPLPDRESASDSQDRSKSCGSHDEEGPTEINTDSLVKEEERETGVVKLSVYKSYWHAVGGCLAPSVLVALFLMQASRNINDWWLSYWVSHSVTPGINATNTSRSSALNLNHLFDDFSNQDVTPSTIVTAGDDITFYLTVYGCLAGANSLFTLFRAFLFAHGGICAARSIHKQLVTNILKAPVSFFDVTPVGRIVNRFSSDVYSIDDSLPFIMNIFLSQVYGILGTVVVTCYGLPWFVILLIPLSLLYYKIQNYYRHTSRELKRISSVTLSPIYAHFAETLHGMTVIRAMREQERFQRENLEHLDMNQRAQFSSQAVASWLSFRLQMLGVAMVTGIAFIAVLEHHFNTINPGLVGLAISYALSVTNLLSGVVTSFAETEKQMVSAERAQQYIKNVPHERFDGSLMPPPNWPVKGSVVFQMVNLRYRPSLPDALNQVSFAVEPAEKVGIVGRTGSGKSSLFLALFRMVEISEGNIFVDGIDLRHLDLHDIRSRLAIIPQDPFLFSGTVRENLDPTNIYTDNELWGVLQKCHLQKAVERMGGLEADVSERGKHFSAGQKQLVCLARAILTRAKILCIDEATASVDLETDKLLQATIRTEFERSTVLTIAHRINTVMDSDRVLVMADGRLGEFAPPQQLLANSDSLFYKLVHGNT